MPILLILIFMFFGCQPALKKNEFNPPNSHPPESTLNSDGDLLTDIEEIRLGLNPYQADLPIIQTYFQGSFQLGHDYQNTAKEKVRFEAEQSSLKEQELPLNQGLREMLIYEVATLNNFRESLEKTTNPHLDQIDGLAILPYPTQGKNYPEQLARGKDLMANLQGIAESGHMSFQLRQGLSFPGKIEIDQVRMRMALVQKKDQHLVGTIMHQDHAGDPKLLTPGTVSPFLNTFNFKELSPQVVHSVLSGQNKIYLGIEDFRLKHPQKETLTYRELLKSVQKKCVQVILSTPEKTERFFIVPQKNLKKTLEQIKVPLEINSLNEVLSINGIISESLDFPVNLKSINPKNLSSKRWFLLKGKGDLDLAPGQTYSFIFLSAEELLSTQDRKIKSFDLSLVPWAPQDFKVQIADELTFMVEGKDVSVGQFKAVERPLDFTAWPEHLPKFFLINHTNKQKRELVLGKDYSFGLSDPHKAWFFLKVNPLPKEALHNYSLQISSEHAKMPMGRILRYSFQVKQDGLF